MSFNYIPDWMPKMKGLNLTRRYFLEWGLSYLRRNHSDLVSHLCFIKHGHVFHDPLGEFTRRKDGFSCWPRFTLLHKIAKSLWHLRH